MSNVTFMKYTNEDGTFVTAFVPGHPAPLTASSASHPNFDGIIRALLADDPDVIDLFDVSKAVQSRLESLSERVSVANGQVYFDGDIVNNSLTKQIVRFLDEDLDDWYPLVLFMENVAANPQEHSRDQLFDWLEKHDFTIDEGGCLIGYKGISQDFKSIRSGPGIVNGQQVNGHLDNSVGNTVEVARSYVNHDPAQGCSSGLHVATFDYAKGWGPVVVKVRVNPRDVVSVPTDCNAQKVRVCRYDVLEVVTQRVTSAYDSYSYTDDEDVYGEDDEDYCDICDGPCRG